MLRGSSGACPDGQLVLEGQQGFQRGRGATKETLLVQPCTVTWDLGIPQSSFQFPICLATTCSSSLLCPLWLLIPLRSFL